MCGKGTQTTQTNNSPPANVLAQYDQVVARANDASQGGYTPYTGQLTAGINGTQQQATDATGNLVGTLGQATNSAQNTGNAALGVAGQALGAANTYQPYFNTATGLAGASAGSITPGQYSLGSANQYLSPAQLAQNQAAANNVGGLTPQQFSNDALKQYLSPYTQNVIDTTSANIDRSNAIQQQGVISNAIGSGNAFGGDRMGVAQAELARNQDLAKNQTIAGLENQNYSQALGQFNTQQGVNLGAAQNLAQLSNQNNATGLGEFNNQQQLGVATQENNAQRQQAAASLYGTLGSAAQSNTLGAYNTALSGLGTNINAGNLLNSTSANALNASNALFGQGTVGQQTSQNDLNALYQQWQNQIAFPYQQIGWLGNISEGIGSNSGGTSTTTGPAPFFSDRRVKEDITHIGDDKEGQKIYRFRYKGQPEFHMGYMAQEVARKHPEAVSSHGGVLAVDYKKATARAAQRRSKKNHLASGGVPTSVPGMDTGPFGLVPASPLSIGHTIPAPPGARQDGTDAAVKNKLMNLGVDAGAKKLSGLDLFGGSSAGAAADPLTAELATPGMGVSGAAGAGADAVGGAMAASALPVAGADLGAAAGLGAMGAADVGAVAGGASLSSILPFLFLKRGGRAVTRQDFGQARMRRAVGGRIGYDDGGVVDYAPDDTTLGAAAAPIDVNPAISPPDYKVAPTGERAITRTMGFEGGLNPRDTNGTPSNFGINAKANPDVDVASLTPDKAKQLYRERYWDTIGGDDLAKTNPALAHVAFDTSVIAGPGKAQALLAASGGDPNKFMDLREGFLGGLVASDPAKYGKYAKSWSNRNAGLRADISGGDLGGASAYADQPTTLASAAPSQAITSNLSSAAPPANDNSIGGALKGFIKQPGMTQALLAGLFGMLGSKSHTLAGAIGEGGLAGIGQYNTGQNIERQNNLLKNTLANTQSEIASRAGQLGLGQQRNALSAEQLKRQQDLNAATLEVQRQRLAQQKALQESEIGKNDTIMTPAGPVSRSTGKPLIIGDGTGGGASAPPPMSAGPTLTAAPAVAKPDAGAPVAPTAPTSPHFSAPVPAVPPPNGFYSEGGNKRINALAEKDLETAQSGAQSATQTKMILGELQNAYNNVPSDSILATGSGANWRTEFARDYNTYATMLGIKPIADPDKVASNEQVNKLITGLGVSVNKGLGREPGYILDKLTKMQPGLENTPTGNRVIIAGQRAVAQAAQDYNDFAQQFVAKNQHSSNLQTEFNKAMPENRYVKEAQTLAKIPADKIAVLQSDPAKYAPLFDNAYGPGLSRYYVQ